MKILVIGRNGQVGWELSRSLLHLGQVVAPDRSILDLSRPDELSARLHEIRPDVIINAAAYTAVDKAESDEGLAMLVNGTAPGILAEVSKKLKALMIHYSTDYVFDGTKEGAYTESDPANPVNVYGRSKLAGEQAIQASGCDYLIFRTSWVYAARGRNFLLTILRLAQEKDNISVVADQSGAPTWARLIAATTAHCLSQAQTQRQSSQFSPGLYHLTATGTTTWHGFAQAIVEAVSGMRECRLKATSVMPIPTVEYPTPARRPMNSELATGRLESSFGVAMPAWNQCLELCLEGMR